MEAVDVVLWHPIDQSLSFGRVMYSWVCSRFFRPRMRAPFLSMQIHHITHSLPTSLPPSPSPSLAPSSSPSLPPSPLPPYLHPPPPSLPPSSSLSSPPSPPSASCARRTKLVTHSLACMFYAFNESPFHSLYHPRNHSLIFRADAPIVSHLGEWTLTDDICFLRWVLALDRRYLGSVCPLAYSNRPCFAFVVGFSGSARLSSYSCWPFFARDRCFSLGSAFLKS